MSTIDNAGENGCGSIDSATAFDEITGGEGQRGTIPCNQGAIASTGIYAVPSGIPGRSPAIRAYIRPGLGIDDGVRNPGNVGSPATNGCNRS